MKDSYSFDVDDEGLQKSYDAHRDAYIKIFDRLGFEYVDRLARCPGRWAARRARSSSRVAETGEDTFVRSPRRLRGQRRGRPHARARRRCPSTTCPPAHVEDTPDTPTIADPRRRGQRARARAPTGPGPAADTLKNVVLMVRQPDGSREPLVVGLPGDREVDLKRLRRPARAGRGRAVRPRRTSPPTRLVKGYIGPGVARRDESRVQRHPLPRRPAGRHRHPLGDRRERAAAGTSSTWSAGRDFTPDGVHRGGRGARGRPGAGRLRSAGARPAASRWATSSSSAASTPRRSDCKVLDAERQAGHRHHGLVRRRASPAPSPPWPRTPATSKGLCWPRELAPFDVHVVATGKDAAVLDLRPPSSPTALDEAGVDRAARRPQGQPGGQVRRRRDPRHADHRRRRPRAWPTGSSRCATGGAASAERRGRRRRARRGRRRGRTAGPSVMVPERRLTRRAGGSRPPARDRRPAGARWPSPRAGWTRWSVAAAWSSCRRC